MKVLLQRVQSASVEVDSEVVGKINQGVVLLVGFGRQDAHLDFDRVASKIANLRIFPDQNDRLNFSSVDLNSEFLLVPQFTLYANTQRGRRPDFTEALAPSLAEENFNALVEQFKMLVDANVATGRFGANMQVHLINDGPFTLHMDF